MLKYSASGYWYAGISEIERVPIRGSINCHYWGENSFVEGDHQWDFFTLHRN